MAYRYGASDGSGGGGGHTFGWPTEWTTWQDLMISDPQLTTLEKNPASSR